MKVSDYSCYDNNANCNKIPKSASAKPASATKGVLNPNYTKTDCNTKVYNLSGDYKGTVSIKSDTQPQIRRINDKDMIFILDNDVNFQLEYKDENGNIKNYEFKIPKGYKWDGASIPEFIQWAVGDKDTQEYAVASMVHDFMCENHSTVDNNRKLSSSVFKALLKKNGTSNWLANIMSWFVDAYQYCFNDWSKSKDKTCLA